MTKTYKEPEPDFTYDPAIETTDPAVSQETAGHEANLAAAGQWKLFWLKFRKHKLAVVSLAVVLVLYLIAAFAEFVAPFDPNQTSATYTYAPPQRLQLLHEGQFMPHVDGMKMTLNTDSMRREFERDPANPIPVGFFVKTGTRDERRAIMGVSHFLEHMFFRGAGGFEDSTAKSSPKKH